MLLCSLTSALVPGALSRDGQGIPMCPATQLIEACERQVAMEETPTCGMLLLVTIFWEHG